MVEELLTLRQGQTDPARVNLNCPRALPIIILYPMLAKTATTELIEIESIPALARNSG